MKKIILYCSKHGGAKCIAEKLESACSEYECQPLRMDFNVEEYDVIVLGSGVYASVLDKRLKEFVKVNMENLKNKKILVYVSGLAKETLEKEVEENFDASFVSNIYYKDKLGGLINFPAMNFFEKAIMKMINKKEQWFSKEDMKTCVNLLDEDGIQKFIGEMNKA